MSPARMTDLSYTVKHGVFTDKGLPGPLICDYPTREASRSSLEGC